MGLTRSGPVRSGCALGPAGLAPAGQPNGASVPPPLPAQLPAPPTGAAKQRSSGEVGSGTRDLGLISEAHWLLLAPGPAGFPPTAPGRGFPSPDGGSHGQGLTAGNCPLGGPSPALCPRRLPLGLLCNEICLASFRHRGTPLRVCLSIPSFFPSVCPLVVNISLPQDKGPHLLLHHPLCVRQKRGSWERSKKS